MRSAAWAALSAVRQGSSSDAGSTVSAWRFFTRRWVFTAKSPMLSSSSSKNSHRTGCSASGGNTSRMPPRTANCPGPSTWSHRLYPAAARCPASAVTSYCPPTSSVKAAFSSTSCGMHRCTMPSTAATTMAAPPAMRCSAASRLFSHWRLYAPGRSCNSRAGSITGVCPVRAARSAACRRASFSSAHSTNTGRPASASTAAVTMAR